MEGGVGEGRYCGGAVLGRGLMDIGGAVLWRGGVVEGRYCGRAGLWRGLTVPPQFPPQPFHSVFSLT